MKSVPSVPMKEGHSLLQTLLNSIKGSDWSMLTDFVSPVFFEVVPTLGMARVFGTIAKGYTNKSQFQKVLADTNRTLEPQLGISLTETTKGTPRLSTEGMSIAEKQKFGELVLQIYFAQIFACDTSILDLRSRAFTKENLWTPDSIYYRWNPSFREGVKNLYSGFYHKRDDLFSKGLTVLNLEHAGDILMNHFGLGGQEDMTLKLSAFKRSFHSIFVACKESRTKLHPDFFALGVYLVSLYENLESLDVSLNVRSAFLKAESIK